MSAVKIVKLGDERTVIEILEPGTYNLCKGGAFAILSSRCSIERVDVFTAFGQEGHWKLLRYNHDSLRVLPTRWERLKAFLRGDDALPRAVTIVDRGRK